MSEESRVNLHATAITVGGSGLIFMGPSGSGKSMLAFACLTEAKRMGIKAYLIADDQVLLHESGQRLFAEAPATIKGMIEIRGTGIVTYPCQPLAALHYAILPGEPTGENRIPPADEEVVLAQRFRLPVIRLLATNPVPLATLMAVRQDIAHLL
ncbi:HPr kinase/phosphorylase [Oryzifoliimicrobium ureilyticus]|uniref:HPr kinase/phosphorylase n=1 Tax=Oryzifoliimicrobium ureilyticus TaxID=3113724 RepID=UPI003076018C